MIERVVVAGAGIMGAGIAQVVAQSGLQVTLVDVEPRAVATARERIGRALQRMVDKEQLTAADAAAACARIEGSTDLAAAVRDADHAIETVMEDLDVKRRVLGVLDDHAPEEVVLASNTSQFSISLLAAATRRPDRVIGSHWFNPPPVMDLIEVIRGVETSDETLRVTLELAERYGKQTIVCSKDTQGFITSRLIVLFALEAMRLVEEGVAEAADIDKACRLAFNHPMGPLATIDFSGLDTTLKVADSMTDQYGERFRPPQLLRSLVAAGRLGRKSGAGFSEYADA